MLASQWQTERLILRPWRQQDIKPIAKINADPVVMQYFPSVLSRAETVEAITRYQKQIEKCGWGLWAAQRKEDEAVIGIIGLLPSSSNLPFHPATEIGWRLAKNYWRQGYALEGAQKALEVAFKYVNLPEVFAVTSAINYRSRLLMQRLNMNNCFKNFMHPEIDVTDPLSENVLYVLTQSRYQKSLGGFDL